MLFLVAVVVVFCLMLLCVACCMCFVESCLICCRCFVLLFVDYVWFMLYVVRRVLFATLLLDGCCSLYVVCCSLFVA